MLSRTGSRIPPVACRAGKQTTSAGSIGLRLGYRHRCSANLSRPLRRISTLQIPPSRTRRLFYRCAFATPLGLALYPMLHPDLVERHPDIVSKYDPHRTIDSLVACNAIIFLAWYVGGVGQRFGVRSLRKIEPFMNRHFVMIPDKSSFTPSRLHTFVTYMFSHKGPFHLGANMFTLWSFGGDLHNAIGTELFLTIYLAGGVFGCFTETFARRRAKRIIPIVGASAGVLAIIAARVLFAPELGVWTSPFFSEENQDKYHVKLSTGLATIVTLDVAGIALGWRRFAHGAHLGGTLFGLAAFTLLGRTIGTTEHGKGIWNEKPYEGPLANFWPTGKGIIHEPDGDYKTTVKPEHPRRVYVCAMDE